MFFSIVLIFFFIFGGVFEVSENKNNKIDLNIFSDNISFGPNTALAEQTLEETLAKIENNNKVEENKFINVTLDIFDFTVSFFGGLFNDGKNILVNSYQTIFAKENKSGNSSKERVLGEEDYGVILNANNNFSLTGENQLRIDSNETVVGNLNTFENKILISNGSSCVLADLISGDHSLSINNENGTVDIVSSLGTKVDISGETNLKAGDGLRLEGDSLRVASSIARDSELHDALTLGGDADYLMLVGQEIVRNLIDLNSHVSGVLPLASGGTGVSDGSPIFNNLNLNGTFSILESGVAPNFYTTFRGADQTGNIIYTLPVDAPADNNYVLTAQTDGTMSWSSVSGTGGVSGIGVAGQVAYWSNANTITGENYLSVSRGGTGLNANAVTDGQILIGNDSGNNFSLASITSGSGIVVTNGAGTITIASTLGTSIDISSETNLAGNSEIILTDDSLSIAASIARDSELHSAVTLSGQNYLSLVGQALIASQINLATNVTGTLPVVSGGTGATTLDNLITLGNHTAGNYIATITGNSQIVVGGVGAENSTATLSIGADSIGDTQLAFDTGQNLTTLSSPTFAGLNLTGLTSGSIIFQGASGLTQDNGNLFWDDVNNRLGIGTASPEHMIDARGNIRSNALYLADNWYVDNYDDSGVPRISMTRTSPNIAMKYDAPGAGAGWYGVHDFYTGYSGNPSVLAMRIINGNVGIGTITPEAPLDIKPSSDYYGFLMRERSSDDIAVKILGGISEGKLYVYRVGNQQHIIEGSNVVFNNMSYAGSDFTINGDGTSNRSLFIVDSGERAIGINYNAADLVGTTGELLINGNVGIGTTSPIAKLDIRGVNSDVYAIAGSTATDGNLRFAGLRFDRSNNVVKFGHYMNSGLIERGFIAINNDGNVGIGTTTPGAKLDVSGSVQVTNGQLNIFDTTNDPRGVSLFRNSLNLGGFNTNGNHVSFYSNSGYDLRFTVNSSALNAMTIKDVSGNVGIGTTSPVTTLDVNRITSSTSTADTIVLLKVRSSGTATSGFGGLLKFDISDSFDYGSIGVFRGSSGDAGDGLALLTNGVKRVFITRNSGLVAIGGGVSPGAQLDILPTVTATSDFKNLRTGLVYNGASTMTNYYGNYISAPTGTGTITNKYALVTEANAGNVGIGLTNPAYKLDVLGDANVSGTLTVGTLTATNLSSGSAISAPYFTATDALGTSSFAGGINIAGNIIPTTDNTYSLGSATNMWKDVYIGPGSLYINGKKVIEEASESMVFSADLNQNLIVQTSGSGDIEFNPLGTGVIQLKGNVQLTAGKTFRTSTGVPLNFSDGILASNLSLSGNLLSAANTNGSLELSANGLGAVYVTTGNFGIGTTGPLEKLDVAGRVRLAQTTAPGTVTDRLYNVGGSLYWNGTNISSGGTGATQWTTSGNDIYYNGGNVGIGTTTPGEKLDIANGHIKLTDGYSYVWGDGSTGINGDSTNDFMDFYTSGTAKVRINSSGNVGIGTTSPTYKLQIESTGTDLFRMVNATTGGYTNWQIGNDLTVTNSGSMLFASGTSFAINNGGSRAVTVVGGNVGIGTTSPSVKLEVAGNIRLSNATSNQLEFSNANVKIYRNTNALQFDSYDGWRFYDMQGSAERLRIDNTGNVGIGTTAPGAKLEISGASITTKGLLNLNGGGTFGPALTWNNTSVGGASFFMAPTDDSWSVGGNKFVLGHGTPSSINADVLIDSFGNLGIGTTAPGAYKLNVAGNIYGSGNLTLAGTMSAGKINSWSDAYTSGGNYLFENAFGGPTIEEIPPLNDFIGNQLLYADQKGFTVSSSGSVTNPNNALRPGDSYATITNTSLPIVVELNGSIASDTDVGNQRVFLQAHSNITGHLVVEVKKTDDTWVTLADEDVSMSSRGYWFSPSVTTVAPYPAAWPIKGVRYSLTSLDQATSHIRKFGWYKKNGFSYPFLAEYNPSIYGQALLSDGTASNPGLSFRGDANTGIFRSYADTLNFATNGAERLRVDSSGNVGIGTTSPGAKLDVNGSVQIGNDSSNQNLIIKGSSGTRYGVMAYNGIYLHATNTTGASPAISFTYGSDQRGVITGFNGVELTNYNSAINLTNLHEINSVYPLNGDGVEQGFLAIYPKVAQTGAANYVGLLLDSTETSLGSGNNALMDLRVSGDSKFIVQNTGNIGIGTASPEYKLHINSGGSGTYPMLISGSSGASLLSVYDNGGNGQIILKKSDYSNSILLNATGDSYFNGGNVGIGTTAPGERLEVNGNIKLTNSGNYLQIDDVFLMENSNQAYLRGADGMQFQLYDTDWVSKMVIDNSGNVGIGTTSPTFKLDVDGTISSGYGNGNGEIRMYQTNGAIEPTLYVSMKTDTTLSKSGLFRGNVGADGFYAYYDTGTGDTGLNNVFDGANIVFGTNIGGTLGERMRIQNNGNVGIGTTSPSNKLSVEGIISSGNGTTAGEIRSYQIDSYPSYYISLKTDTVARKSGLYRSGFFSYFDTNTADVALDAVHATAGSLMFKINGAEKMRVDRTTGSVGIGTTSPAAWTKLDVDGTFRADIWAFSNGEQLNPGYTTPAMYSPANATLGIATNGLERMRIDASGNVGIGATNPIAKLEVNSSDQTLKILSDLSTSSSNGRAFAINANGETYARSMFYSNGVYGVGSGSSTRDVFFGRSDTGSFRIGSSHDLTGNANLVINGNVGIGTTSPSSKLHISGGNFQIGESTMISGNPYQYFYGYDAATSSAKYGRVGVEVDGSFNIQAEDSYLVLGASSYVQIQDTALLLEGMFMRNNKPIKMQNTEGSFKDVMILDGSNLLKVGAVGSTWTTGGEVALFTGGLEKMRITNAGNVGIGTTSPEEKLDVVGNIKLGDDNEIYNSGGAIGRKPFRLYSTTDKGILDLERDGIINVRVAAEGNSWLNGAGNVGIGVTNPLKKLHITGTGIANKTVLNETSVLVEDTEGLLQFVGADTGSYSASIVLTAAPSSGANKNWGLIASGPDYSNMFSIGYATGINSVGSFEGSRLFNITTAGKVGIGTTNPSKQLHLHRNDSVSGASLILGNESTGDASIGFLMTSGTPLYFGVDNSDSDFFKISASEDLGSPYYKLSTNGADSGLSEYFRSSNSDVEVARFNNINTGSSAGAKFGFTLYNSTGSNYAAAQIGAIKTNTWLSTDDTTVDSALRFLTRGDNVLGEKMRIDASGNVGIGTTSPSAQLTLAKADSSGLTDFLVNPTVKTSGNLMDLQVAGSSKFRVTFDGALIANYIYADLRNSSDWNNATISPGITGTLIKRQKADENPTLVVHQQNASSTGDILQLKNSASTVFTVQQSGNVGIGTTSPTTLLEVSKSQAAPTHLQITNINDGAGAVAGIVLNQGTVTNHTLNLLAADTDYTNGYMAGRGSITTDTDSLGLTLGARNATGDIRFYTGLTTPTLNSSERMIITNAGDVGIGTSSPAYKLDVNGSGIQLTDGTRYLKFLEEGSSSYQIKSSGWLLMEGTGVSGFQFNKTGGTGGVIFYDGANTEIAKFNSNGNIYLVHNKGNVGIGTTAPTYALDVRGASTTSGVNSQAGYNINLLAPPVAPTGSLAPGTNLGIGQYYYFVTYVTATGETSAGAYFAITTTAGNQAVDLTIPVSSDPRVTARKIYRTKVGATSDNEYYLATVSDNSTTSYSDTIADASLTGPGLQNYKINTTSRYITTAGVQSMIIDKNLVALGLNAGNDLIVNRASAVRTVLIGDGAGEKLTTGYANVIVGKAGGNLTTGGSNSILGDLALYGATSYSSGVAIGSQTARFITSGSASIFIGGNAGNKQADGTTNLTSSNSSIYIGYNAKGFDNSDSNSIVIGAEAIGLGANTAVLGNSSITKTALFGNVGIGTTNPEVKLQVNGDVRIATASAVEWGWGSSGIIGNDTDKSLSFFNVPSSARVERMRIDSAGNVGIGTTSPGYKLEVNGDGYFSTKLGIGTATDSNANPSTLAINARSGEIPLSIKGNIVPTTTAINTITNISPSFANTVADGRSLYGMYVNPNTSGSTFSINNFEAGRFYAYPKGVVNISNAYGFDSKVSLQSDYSGTVTNAYGFYSNIENSGTGTLTNGYGAFIGSPYNNGGGSFLNNYGLYIADQSAVGSTSHYNIYSAGANSKNYFAGNVGIGTTSPGAKLDIGLAGTSLGTLRLAGNTSGYVQIQPSAAAGSWTMTLPGAVGGAGQQLTDVNGDGITSWAAAGSLRSLKNIDSQVIDPSTALNQIVNTPIYNFHYKKGMGTGDSSTQYVGVMADEASWAMHYDGNVINPVNTLGYMVLGVKALDNKINLQNQNITETQSITSLLGEQNDVQTQNFASLLEVTESHDLRIANSENKLDELNVQTQNIASLLQEQIVKLEELSNQELNFAWADLFASILDIDDATGTVNILNIKDFSAEVTETGMLVIKVNNNEDATIGTAVICPALKELDENGKCEINQVDENNDGLDDNTGNAISNGKSVIVKTGAVKNSSKVFVTIKSKLTKEATLMVTDITENESFDVELVSPTEQDVTFDWWIVEMK